MRQSGVLLNGRESCEDLILTLKADMIFRLYSCQLLFAPTDTSTFLGKKILVEPFTCQSKAKGSSPSGGGGMLSQPQLVKHRGSPDEPCRMCVYVGSFEHVSAQRVHHVYKGPQLSLH